MLSEYFVYFGASLWLLLFLFNFLFIYLKKGVYISLYKAIKDIEIRFKMEILIELR